MCWFHTCRLTFLATMHWLDMYDFLLSVPHGRNGKTVSEANARSVIKQVEKLVSGAGVGYHHWKPDVIFAKVVQ